MLKEWAMILEIAFTGQHIALDVASEAECKAAMARIAAGAQMIVTTKEGLRFPIARGLGCIPKTALTGGV